MRKDYADNIGKFPGSEIDWKDKNTVVELERRS